MKHAELIRRMTLEEKASLTSGANFWNTKPVARLDIAGMMLTDGPHGLRKQGGKADHLGLNNSVPATCYPTAAGLANSWDETLLEEVGAHLGLEAASEGVSVLLGPGCNIKRNPLCGRNFEYFSEDPLLAGKMAAALIRGIQSNGISACVKHFAANSQELRRMANDSVVDERTLRELYLPAFEAAVKEGGVKCLMTAYNKLNGIYTNEHPHLLREILYGEWGYDGMVVSDWGGNNDRVAAIKAGSTLEMPSSGGQSDRKVVQAVRAGTLDEALLDEQVDRLLETVLCAQHAIKEKTYDRAQHHEIAANAASKAAVLLKNEDGILPLRPETRVAVIGDFAVDPRYQGAGSSKINPTKLENGLDALRAEGVQTAGYAKGFRRGGRKDNLLIRQACNLAAKADAALVWLGLDEGGEAEGIDRADMRLPENQLALLQAVARVNPNVIVVLSCGCAVEMDWDTNAKAVLHGYLGGQAGALAIAGLLSGRLCPCGKLSETIPERWEDVASAPYYPGAEKTSEYREGIYVGYRYFDTARVPVRYPFGHGLSYTRFAYSDLTVTDDAVSFTIENVGDVFGEEVAQLYIAARTEGMFRPAQELKGFVRAALAPGESTQVTIGLNSRSFAVWSIAENGWVIEPGTYELRIGASSRDIRLTASIVKDGAAVENPYAGEAFAPYYGADIKNVPDESFAALLGREIPPAKWDPAEPIGFNDAISRCAALRRGPGKALYRSLTLLQRFLRAIGQKEKANSLTFLLDLPWRGIARMSGVLCDEQVYALLSAINCEKGGWRSFFRTLSKKQ